MNHIKYSIVAPAYNEEECIEEFYCRMKAVMEDTREPYEMIFINDGSRDSTLDKLLEIQKQDKT